MYLNLETGKKNGLHLEAMHQRAPFTLRVSAELGSSVNREPVHVTRAVVVSQALDDTEITGYCPRDSFFSKLWDFQGKRLFQYKYFITFCCPLVGQGGQHLLT